MRALNQEEYAFLNGREASYVLGTSAANDALELCERMRVRGCMVRLEGVNCRFSYELTPLGRLALRVSRPDQAVML